MRDEYTQHKAARIAARRTIELQQQSVQATARATIAAANNELRDISLDIHAHPELRLSRHERTDGHPRYPLVRKKGKTAQPPPPFPN